MYNHRISNTHYARQDRANSTHYAYIQQFGGGAAAAAILAYSSQSLLLYIAFLFLNVPRIIKLN